MTDIIRKFASRKFIAAAASFLFGAIIAVLSLDVNVAVSCMGAGISGATTLTSIITEGRIDLAAVKKTVDAFKEAAEAIASDDSDSPEKNE